MPKIYALFGTICGRGILCLNFKAFTYARLVFAFRSQAAHLEGKIFVQIEQYYMLAKKSMERLSNQTGGDSENIDASLHVVRVFEVELRSQKKEWDAILKLVDVAICIFISLVIRSFHLRIQGQHRFL